MTGLRLLPEILTNYSSHIFLPNSPYCIFSPHDIFICQLQTHFWLCHYTSQHNALECKLLLFLTSNHIMSWYLSQLLPQIQFHLSSTGWDYFLLLEHRGKTTTEMLLFFLSALRDTKEVQHTGYPLVPRCGKSQQNSGWLNTAFSFPSLLFLLNMFCCSRAEEYLSMWFRQITLHTALK